MSRSTSGVSPGWRGWRPARAALVVLAVPVAFGVAYVLPSQAASTGCAVTYSITSQWSGGFGGDVKVTNLGSAVNGWTLTWSFTAGQVVTQAWNATVTQSGAAVSAASVSYNAALATNATADFGFNASWTGSNPAPASFALNGATCTGTPTTSAPPSASPSPSATPTRSPSSSPTPSASTSTTSSGGGTHGLVNSSITGDSRSVHEPSVPSTVCSSLTATLSMSSRTASSSQESSPPDTSRIQSALDSCTTSSGTVAVELKAGSSANAFLSGPLTIHQGEVLLVDSGVTLFASRNPASYQVSGKPTCGTTSSGSGGCVPFITVSGANAGIEGRQSSSGSQGIIDGRGDQTILGTSTTWWGLASQAKSSGLRQQNPRLVQANSSNNFTLYHIDLINAANFHVVYSGNGFTAWGVRIKTPDNAGNTDGIDPSGATNVTITNSYIEDGDDGVAIKGGSASSNMTISNNHFYGTHGISIGSETNGGVTNILFANNTLTGTDSFGTTSGSATGIRIKSSQSNGGSVTNVEYDNTCMTAVKAPIVFNTHYSTDSGSSIPVFTGIVIDGASLVNAPSGTKSTFDGYDSSRPLGLTMWNVSLATTTNTSDNANIRLYNSNIKPSGTAVTVTNVSGSGSVPSCSFPSFPAL